MNWKVLMWVLVGVLFVACGSDEFGSLDSVDQSQFHSSCIEQPRVTVRGYSCWGEQYEGNQSQPEAFMLGPFEEKTVVVPGYRDTSVSVRVARDWDLSANLLTVDAGDSYTAVAMHGEMRNGHLCPAFTIAVGVDDPWFSCQGFEPSRNDAELFTSGEAMWSSLKSDLDAAQVRVNAATWWWQSDFELVRSENHVELSMAQRTPNTVMATLEALDSVVRRVIVARFAPDMAAGLAYFNSDPALRKHGADGDSSFQVMSQGNPTQVPVTGEFQPHYHPVPFVSRLLKKNPELAELGFEQLEQTQQALDISVEAASYHQKVWVVDGKTAYVSGMNVKSTDWDTDQHLVFEPFRMKFASTTEERLAVSQRKMLPDVGPRKDYGIRIVGPAALDVDRVLQERWDLGIAQEELFSDSATRFDLLDPPKSVEDGVELQVQTTMPEPFGRQEILESMAKAIRNAEDFIYIEDQYFRMPIVLDAFREALKASPDLYVVVVTKPVSITDGALKWSILMDDEIRNVAKGRYALYTMNSFSTGFLEGAEVETPVFLPMDIHAKLLIVDDQYLSVGSCNKNNRGLLLEGEMNVAVLDAEFVRAARRRILAIATGQTELDLNRPGAVLFQELKTIADSNQELLDWCEETGVIPDSPPQGFLYPLDFGDEYLLDVGPDLF